MTENKRFYLDENGINDREYEFSILGEDELVDIINGIVDENKQLKEENKELKKENQMLKHTIGRNESYIAGLTHKGEWKDTSKPLYGSINRGNGMTEINERVTVDFDEQSYYLDGEYWESWDNYGEEMADKINELLNELAEENKRLKSINQDYCNYIGDFEDDFIRLAEENKKLQERNDRQYKQLGDLYRLIEEKDWRALTDILDDFKKADEQLQKEWKCYE